MFGGVLFLGGAGVAQANDRNCGERLRNEQYKLERDIRRHGAFSRQAQNRREHILRLRQQCGFGFRGNRNERWDDRRGWRDRDREYRDERRRNERRWENRNRIWRWF